MPTILCSLYRCKSSVTRCIFGGKALAKAENHKGLDKFNSIARNSFLVGFMGRRYAVAPPCL
jgi:hypothetical protein